MTAVATAVPLPPAVTVPAITVRDIVESADISGLAVSPDGTRIAYRVARASIAKDDYDLAWFVAPINASSPPRRIADGGAARFTDAGTLAAEAPVWSRDSRYLYYRATTDDAQVWRANVTTARAEPVTKDPGEVESFSLSADGRFLTYRAGATRAATAAAMRAAIDQGVRIDPDLDFAQPLAGGILVAGKRQMQRYAGRWFSRAPLLARTPLREVRVDLATGAAVTSPNTIDPAAPSGTVRRAAVSARGDTAEITSGPGGRTLRVTRASGAMVECIARLCTTGKIRSAAWVPGHDALILNARSGARGDGYYRWAVGSRTMRLVVQSEDALNGGRAGQSGCAPTRAALVCVEATAVAPPRLVRVDLKSGRRSIVDDPNSDLRGRIDLSAKTLAWRDGEGHEFAGILLTSPALPARAPLVIDYYHCDGFLRGGVGTELPMLPIAAQRTAVLCIDQSPIAGPQNAVADNVRALSGIRAIVAKLAGEDVIDAKRVGMAGLSFGSEVTLWTAMNSDLLAAAAISSGAIMPAYYWANALPGRDVPGILKQVYGIGNPDEDPAGWQRVSPARNIDRLTIPILMQLPEVEARWMLELHTRLRRAGQPVELYAFADEPHILTGPRHQAATYGRTLDWFGFWLQGRTDDDPAKAAQFAGWQALKAEAKPAVVPSP